MRIVGGTLKGRKLVPFDEKNVRPTSDMVRESLFNILRDDIAGASFLDLFSGTGAVGIEAFSRGAEHIVFCELSNKSSEVLKKNLLKCGIFDERAIEIKIGDSCEYVKKENSFDFIYVDPPYKSDCVTKILPYLKNVLSERGIAIIETETPFCFDEISFGLEVCDTRRYGKAHLTFLRRTSK